MLGREGPSGQVSHLLEDVKEPVRTLIVTCKRVIANKVHNHVVSHELACRIKITLIEGLIHRAVKVGIRHHAFSPFLALLYLTVRSINLQGQRPILLTSTAYQIRLSPIYLRARLSPATPAAPQTCTTRWTPRYGSSASARLPHPNRAVCAARKVNVKGASKAYLKGLLKVMVSVVDLLPAYPARTAPGRAPGGR
jgi:hypothetical protein